MQFIESSDKIEIRFDISDTPAEKGMLKQGVYFILQTLNRIREIEERIDKLVPK